jgi:outer membrane protein OmpA-like peptidoglycan-associated protein
LAPEVSIVKALPLIPHSTPGLRTAALFLAMALGACSTPAPGPGSGQPASSGGAPAANPAAAPPSTPTRPVAPAPPSPLVSEQRWLDEWFRGTPVVIALADANTLAVDVPLANAFASGSSAVKPALVAVLDRVATSLRRQASVRISIAAPNDATGGSVALASARAAQVRDHLVSRGVPATRMAGVGTARAGAPVQLRLMTLPQAIGRLDDASLPVPAAGVKPAVAAPASGAKR